MKTLSKFCLSGQIKKLINTLIIIVKLQYYVLIRLQKLKLIIPFMDKKLQIFLKRSKIKSTSLSDKMEYSP